MHHGIKILTLLFTLTVLAGCAKLPVSTFKKGKPLAIAFYNTEKFFDTTDDPATADEAFTPTGEMEWTPERYQRKVHNIASVLSGIGSNGGPAVVGLAEVENQQVLQDLVNSPELRKNKYSIIHYDMADEEGLDIAMLYKPKIFEPTAQRRIKVNYGRGSAADRDILQVNGQLQGQPVTIFVNHWPSRTRTRRGLQDDSHLRAAAVTMRQQIDSLQAVDKNARIIVMGDFDAAPDTEVLEKMLKATGRPNPYYNQELFNTFYLLFVDGQGSYDSYGQLQMLDQIMISKSLVDGDGLEYVRGSATVYDPEKIKVLYGKYKDTPRGTFSGTTYFGGYSDHFPVYIMVRKVKR